MAPKQLAFEQDARKALLAATPPPRRSVLAPTCIAARRSLIRNTSTTAAWKLAARFAICCLLKFSIPCPDGSASRPPLPPEPRRPGTPLT